MLLNIIPFLVTVSKFGHYICIYRHIFFNLFHTVTLGYPAFRSKQSIPEFSGEDRLYLSLPRVELGERELRAEYGERVLLGLPVEQIDGGGKGEKREGRRDSMVLS